MKKTTKIFLSALCIAAIGGSMAAVSGCGAKSDADINISGSTSVGPLMSILADTYMELNDDVNIIVQTTDSSSGIADAAAGKLDFGMASRNIKDGEDGVTQVQICTDGVVFVAGLDCAVDNVTGAEIYGLYANGTAIQDTITYAITREDGSGTRDAFDGLIKNESGDALSALTSFHSAKISEQQSTSAVLTNVNSYTAGYISLGSLDETKVKALNFEGVKATVANIQSGDYKLSRPFNVVYNTANGLSGAAKEFLDWILGSEGQKIISDNSYVPLG